MTLQHFLLPALLASTLGLAAQNSTSFELRRDPTTNNGNLNVAGDFNNDGKPDFVSGLTLRLGNGDGTFQAPRSLGATHGGIVQDLAVADLNHDGKLDVAVVEYGNGSFVEIFYGNGDGTFQPAVSFSPASNLPTQIAVADFNGDGLPDIAVGDQNGSIQLFRNAGGNSFVSTGTLKLETANVAIASLRSGDFDANGTVDLAASTSDGVYALWGDGHGNFSPVLLRPYSPPYGTVTLGVGDLNQDGNTDIIASYTCGTPFDAGKNPGTLCTVIDVFYGQGNRSTFYRPAVTEDGVNVYSLQAVDINSDGIGDLVGSARDTHSQQGLFAYLGHPDGSFDQTPQRYIAASEGAGSLAAGDWNRDGKMDFVQSLVSDGTIEIYLNATAAAPCATSQINPTVTVCSPVDGTYLNSPVRIQATTFDTTPVTQLQEYIDFNLLYSAPVTTFNITSTLSPGSHLLVTKAWDASGLSFRSNRRITVYSGTPGSTCAATPDAPSICLPSGDTGASPVHIVANGYTPVIPTAAQLYIDNNLVINDRGCLPYYCPGGTTSIDTFQALPTGTHVLVFKLFDANGAVYTASRNVTVQ